MAVSFRCPRLPWGLWEGQRQKYFSFLYQSTGTQVVNMSDWGSILIYPKTLFDEAAGLAFLCCHSPFILHYYWIDYIKYLKQLIYIKRMFSSTLWAKMNKSFLMLLTYLSVDVFSLRCPTTRFRLLLNNLTNSIIARRCMLRSQPNEWECCWSRWKEWFSVCHRDKVMVMIESCFINFFKSVYSS